MTDDWNGGSNGNGESGDEEGHDPSASMPMPATGDDETRHFFGLETYQMRNGKFYYATTSMDQAAHLRTQHQEVPNRVLRMLIEISHDGMKYINS